MKVLKNTENPVQIRQHVMIDTKYGPAKFVTFTGLTDHKEHIALVFGDLAKIQTPLVRIHSECLTGDVFSSARCDCGEQLDEAQASIALQGGVLLYLRQEGRGIGLYNKLDAYAMQDKGHDTFVANTLVGMPEEMRNYEVAAQMLQSLGVSQVNLLTNNPEKVQQLREYGVAVVQRIPTKVHLKSQNKNYLLAKVLKGGHGMDLSQITFEKKSV